MKIRSSHSRDIVGQAISISIEAGDYSVVEVITRLDGITIDDDRLESPSESYVHEFRQIGTAGPGQNHTLVITAMDDSGKTHSATTEWTDPD